MSHLRQLHNGPHDIHAQHGLVRLACVAVLPGQAHLAVHVINPNYGYGVRGFPKDQGFDSIGLRQLSLKPDPGGSPQWRWISQRSTAVLMTSAKCSRTGKRTS